jgi:formamidopyrimidine-DNA glycosylase
MPELPEVETYVRDLAGRLPGRTFRGARTDWPNQLPRNDPAQIGAQISGQTVVAVQRRGKYILVRLSRDWLIVHLKMSGRLELAPATSPPNPYAHVVFSLDHDEELRFHDPRKFGRVYLVADPEIVVGALGPEPLSEELTEQQFVALIAQRRGALKALLLNQAFLAGLGNIYADEALWHARLHPLRTADTLKAAEARRLYSAIRHVLQTAVDARGTTFSSPGYRDLDGMRGENAPSLAVFRRTGEPCPRCGATIARILVGQRSTHFCGRCQRR